MVSWVRLRGIAGTLALDVIVILNGVIVGREVDTKGEPGSPNWQPFQYAFCGFYFAEIGFRLCSRQPGVLEGYSKKLEILFVLIACFGVFILGKNGQWLWRLTAVRLLRLTRIYTFASHTPPLKDLWLAICGIARGFKAMLGLFFIMVVVTFAFGAAAAGLVAPGSEEEEAAACSHSDGVIGDCLDVYVYFGTMGRSMLTMLQMVSLDGWAARVVRPLAEDRPLAAIAITGFCISTAYALVSVAIGVFVWSTVDLARSSESHASKVQINEDMATIITLRKYFEASLLLEDRETLTRADLRDAMFVPAVAKAFRRLELPVEDVDELFLNLDTERRGEITLDELEKGMQIMKQPTTRFDVACLTARIGGSVTFAGRLHKRTEAMYDQLGALREALEGAFDDLGALADPESDSGQVAEVGLRQAGKIHIPPPAQPCRYTG